MILDTITLIFYFNTLNCILKNIYPCSWPVFYFCTQTKKCLDNLSLQYNWPDTLLHKGNASGTEVTFKVYILLSPPTWHKLYWSFGTCIGLPLLLILSWRSSWKYWLHRNLNPPDFADRQSLPSYVLGTSGIHKHYFVKAHPFKSLHYFLILIQEDL